MYQLETKNVAPVLIPTLNRDKHLISLLESLSKCRLANQTEVYIALDYPLRSTHEDGYKRICEYLKGVNNMGFKKLHIIKRDINYGFGENGNASSLIKQVLKTHDRYIFTEDDNIFAPGFLEFMNYNLQLYQADQSVLAISGYMYPIEFPYENPRILKLEHFSAWGYGTWKDRHKKMLTVQNSVDEKLAIITDNNTKIYCIKHRPNLYTDLVGMVNGKPILGDSLYSMIQIYKNWKTIFPSKSLVRNCGWDGTGTHGGIVEKYISQPIENEANIEDYIVASEEENAQINLLVYNYHKQQIPLIQKILTLITLRLFNMTGKYYNFEKFRTLYKRLFR